MGLSKLPIYVEGLVVKGFGRGSKQLGCPTANYSLEVVKKLPPNVAPGTYYGWAQLDCGTVHKMVTHIGWCPFYQNKDMSVETHIMHKFDNDFYGSYLKIVLTGYLRGEQNFDSVEELKNAINTDIDNANRCLDTPEHAAYKSCSFFAPKEAKA